MEHNIVMACCLFLTTSAIATAQCGQAQIDLDYDGVDDALEARLLQQCAPIIKLDVGRSGPEQNVGIPVSVTRLIQHCFLREYPQGQFYPLADVGLALNLVTSRADRGAGMRLQHRDASYRWGYSDIPGGASDWTTAIARNDGVYGRVWRPWGASHCDLFSVQYFILLTWSETSASLGFGNHEGDWLCIDFTVDVRANPDFPRILNAIYHNHGRQFFIEPRCLEFEDGHPVMYMENGVNEAWPNAGRGDSWASRANWPNRHGFATNQNLDYEGGIVDEDDTRDHTGVGNRWETYRHPIPNIGGLTNFDPCAPGGVPNSYSLCGDEGHFILTFQGHWGTYGNETDPPKSPVYQSKMWARSWKSNRFGEILGPWAACGPLIPGDSMDPFEFPLSACVPLDGIPPYYPHCLWFPIGYSFAISPRPAADDWMPFYVQFGGANYVEGSQERPYNAFSNAVWRAPRGSELRMNAGTSAFTGTISTQVRLKAVGGTVTIGR